MTRGTKHEYGDAVGYLGFVFIFGLTLISLGLGFEDLGKNNRKIIIACQSLQPRVTILA
jgi:predicted transporter